LCSFKWKELFAESRMPRYLITRRKYVWFGEIPGSNQPLEDLGWPEEPCESSGPPKMPLWWQGHIVPSGELSLGRDSLLAAGDIDLLKLVCSLYEALAIVVNLKEGNFSFGSCPHHVCRRRTFRTPRFCA